MRSLGGGDNEVTTFAAIWEQQLPATKLLMCMCMRSLVASCAACMHLEVCMHGASRAQTARGFCCDAVAIASIATVSIAAHGFCCAICDARPPPGLPGGLPTPAGLPPPGCPFLAAAPRGPAPPP